jgi:hypothetical protein
MVVQGVEAGAAIEAGAGSGAPDPDQWRYDLAAERAADLAAGRSTGRPVEDVLRDYGVFGRKTGNLEK